MRDLQVARTGAVLGVTAALWILAGDLGHAASDETGARSSSRLGISDPFTRIAVQGALRGAQRRLSQARCQHVLGDFNDAAGRPLQENLAKLEQTSDGYLEMLFFRDGGESPQCQRRAAVLAYTSVGSRVVFVCGERFAKRRLDDRVGTEFVVIHEALHSLGLQENPPSSSEITAQVRFRCR